MNALLSVAGYYKRVPTPPEPPTTRTSLEEEGGVVSEPRVASEFGDWSITSSFTAWATNGDVILLLELAKHLKEPYSEEVLRGRRGNGWILWGWFGNFPSVSGKSVMAVKERLEAMKKEVAELAGKTENGWILRWLSFQQRFHLQECPPVFCVV